MEAAARFVFASGGAVRAGELVDFLRERPEISRAFYDEAAPQRQLKKILRSFGAAHGLSWVDATGLVSHALTEAQRGVFPSTELQLVPMSLRAVDSLLRATPSGRVTVGELARFYTEFPLETAFMRRRSGGVLQFVRAYDSHATRVAANDKEMWLVHSRSQPEPEPGRTAKDAAEPVVVEQTQQLESYEQYSSEEMLTALRGTLLVLGQRRVPRSLFSQSVDVLLYEVCRMAHRSALPRKPVVFGPKPKRAALTKPPAERSVLGADQQRGPAAPRSPVALLLPTAGPWSSPPFPSPPARLLVPTGASLKWATTNA